MLSITKSYHLTLDTPHHDNPHNAVRCIRRQAIHLTTSADWCQRSAMISGLLHTPLKHEVKPPKPFLYKAYLCYACNQEHERR